MKKRPESKTQNSPPIKVVRPKFETEFAPSSAYNLNTGIHSSATNLF